MIIKLSIFNDPWIEKISTNAKLLIIYFELLTEYKDEVSISKDRICFDTGLNNSTLNDSLKEISIFFSFENNKVVNKKSIYYKLKKL